MAIRPLGTIFQAFARRNRWVVGYTFAMRIILGCAVGLWLLAASVAWMWDIDDRDMKEAKRKLTGEN
jgi:hypothetical protein